MANYQNNSRCMRRPMSGPAQITPTGAPGRHTPKIEGCPGTQDHFPADMPIAMAYVPWQKWKNLYDPAKALESGTIFAELDKPFLGKGGMRR